jgi:hypothetical protein
MVSGNDIILYRGHVEVGAGGLSAQKVRAGYSRLTRRCAK